MLWIHLWLRLPSHRVCGTAGSSTQIALLTLPAFLDNPFVSDRAAMAQGRPRLWECCSHFAFSLFVQARGVLKKELLGHLSIETHDPSL
jgi:hypothetical protein